MSRATVVACLMSLLPIAASAQPRQRFYYPAPDPASVTVATDVRYASVDTSGLMMDVYRPAKTSVASPALIFFFPLDDGRRTTRQANEWIRSWARLAAANGIVGVIPDFRKEHVADDFRRVVSFLTENGATHGVDRERLAIFSGSAAVTEAFPLVEDPELVQIKAAVMYYGSATVSRFRADLPVLYVRAGLDHPDMNRDILQLASLAISQNAPVTLLNHHTGHHRFEGADDDDATRRVIDQTIAFVKDATSPAIQSVNREKRLDAVAAGFLSTKNYREAAATFAELIKLRPNEGLLGFRYAEALLSDKQYAAACAEFTKPASPSFAAIVPGTRACVLAGSHDAAISFLNKFQKDWLRSESAKGLKTEADFAPLWDRADFKALFK